ncbi:MAG: protein-tyrosine-phosphatase [Flavobacteriales bacterium]|nr:MAG: protein-tyrosine-phosphatase [Flavobacteriales bacterium]
MKILMVCLGNICRSPLAEGIMKEKMKTQFEDFQVDSAGTISLHQGSLPDARSIKTAFQHGIDIENQRSRPITQNDLKDFDYIFCMDKNNYRDVMELAETETQKAKIHLFLEFANQQGAEVPDPYYGGADGFEKVYQMLDKAADIVVEKLKTN